MMDLSSMEIHPKHGIGDITFGMSPDQAQLIMNEPSTYERWMGGNLNDALTYSGLVLRFDKQNAVGPLPTAQLKEIWADNSRAFTFYDRIFWDEDRTELELILIDLGVDYILRGPFQWGSELFIQEYSWTVAFGSDENPFQFWLENW
jgi:hypothetical protein